MWEPGRRLRYLSHGASCQAHRAHDLIHVRLAWYPETRQLFADLVTPRLLQASLVTMSGTLPMIGSQAA